VNKSGENPPSGHPIFRHPVNIPVLQNRQF